MSMLHACAFSTSKAANDIELAASAELSLSS